ncbi:hypothetical protein Taro_056735, partial [Colocasia esculenta]|nr:hypothetical protein [Colocasia esculenta]
GACAYDNVFTHGYGTMTTALSTVLFNGGATYGACYEIRPSNNDDWCNPPLRHFDLKIAQFKAGIVPVEFRRVPCVKSGGMKFEMKRHMFWIAVLVYNVRGAGDLRAVAVKGTRTGWIAMIYLCTKRWGKESEIYR